MNISYKKITIKGFGFWGVQSEEELQKGQKITIKLKYGGEEHRTVANKIKDGLYTLEPNGKSRAKKENRADKYKEWSAKNEQKSNDAYHKNDQYRDFLSLGEPIKIGHHSEGRHRRLLDRVDSNMRKSVELQDKAEEQSQRAENIQDMLDPTVYTDDIGVIATLEQKVSALELKREGIKAFNKSNPEEKHPSFVLTNLGAKIRQNQKKLEAVKIAYA